MSEQLIEKVSEETEEEETEETEPVFFNPKALSLVASLAEWIAWIVLAGFIGHVAAQFVSLNAQTQGATLSDLFAQAGAAVIVPYLVTNMLVPLLTGLTFFLVLLGVGMGLNVLREIEFNQRENK